MPRPGISSADVVRAYVALRRSRRRPSLLNLRLELGRGSFTTIAQRLERLAFVQHFAHRSTKSEGDDKVVPRIE